MIGTFEQNFYKKIDPKVSAYATVAVMRRKGINTAEYSGIGRMRLCEYCGGYYDARKKWIEKHLTEIEQEVMEMNRKRPPRVSLLFKIVDYFCYGKTTFQGVLILLLIGLMIGIIWKMFY